MTPGSTMPVSAAAEMGESLPKRTGNWKLFAFPPNTLTGQYGEVKRPAPKPKRKPTEKPAESERNAMDQVHDAEAEAYQAFLNQDYLQQEAVERNIDMRELWNEMKNEFMAEYFQMPYTQKR